MALSKEFFSENADLICEFVVRFNEKYVHDYSEPIICPFPVYEAIAPYWLSILCTFPEILDVISNKRITENSDVEKPS